ncbi:IS110 family RNA-guided transposase [Thiosocius teredinicola]|uniref:IS110 family transposase n=1 Tax=Thiosocius teredinicola TaxID=1973002 RepID=UPI000990B365
MAITYVGLDVSQKATSICVIDDAGAIVWEGCCRSHPEDIIASVKKQASGALRVGLETGPLAVWHWHTLKAAGLPVVCLHARHVHAAIALQVNKTDRNDAYALAQVVRAGWFRAVDVKSLDTHRIRLVLTARKRVVSMRSALYSQIRGVLKTFGIVLPAGKGSRFEHAVHQAIESDESLEPVIGSLLEIWRSLTAQLRFYNRAVDQMAKESDICQRLMTIPGVGVLTALAFMTAIDDPNRFMRSADVGPYLGLTPRRYQSGEVDRAGHISKCGDRMARTQLFEAAHVMMTRSETTSPLQVWANQLRRRIGVKKAKVALARRLAVVMHRMWIDGTSFDCALGEPIAA